MTADQLTEPEEATVEKVARAMWGANLPPGVYGRMPWDRVLEVQREQFRGLAAAAIAAMPASRGRSCPTCVREGGPYRCCPHCVDDPDFHKAGVRNHHDLPCSTCVVAALVAPQTGQHTPDEETDR